MAGHAAALAYAEIRVALQFLPRRVVDLVSSVAQEQLLRAGPEEYSSQTPRSGVMAQPTEAELVAFAHELADVSAGAILPHFRTQLVVSNKARGCAFDPVTAADQAAERAIRSRVAARFPEHGIIGEEFGEVGSERRYRWVIDPIDGTRAFITGSPLWGTLIGLMDEGRPLLGLMNQPFTAERFWSEGGRLRWRGPHSWEKTLRTRACGRLADAVLTTTHPDLFAGDQATAFGAIRSRVHTTRYGGDCYGYCLLAAGFIDIIVECGLKPYDVVALIPIIESAGGLITTWDGQPAAAGGCIVAAGDQRVHREAIAVLRGLP
jgi:histidinol phosphatase-like enzyme (inositol monophosphatase family)